MSRSHLLIAAAGIALAMAPPVAAQAQQGDPDLKLEEVERSLKSAASKAGRLSAEVESIEEERADLRRKLIDSAARIRDREEQITAGEARLVALGDEEADLRDRLTRRRNAMGEMLAALQKLEREPPPVLAVRPGDAVAAIRSAMLLATVVPQIRAEADALTRSLRRLATLRDETIEEQRQLDLNRIQLDREHEVIERLLEVKNALATRTAKQRDAAQRRAEALAAEAASLKDLLARLEQERRRTEAEAERERALAAARAGDADRAGEAERESTGTDETRLAALETGEPPTAEERRLAMARPDRLEPAVAFADAAGTLSLPASGEIIRAFGADDGYGGDAKGVSIETRERAQVTAPADGWVVYGGEFRGYGQLLIIDTGGGYHVLLAGMGRIDVSLGQFVLAGEPVGIMGQKATQSAALGATAGGIKPVLYVEFRKEGNSIDPHPWWAAANVKARG